MARKRPRTTITTRELVAHLGGPHTALVVTWLGSGAVDELGADARPSDLSDAVFDELRRRPPPAVDAGDGDEPEDAGAGDEREDE